MGKIDLILKEIREKHNTWNLCKIAQVSCIVHFTWLYTVNSTCTDSKRVLSYTWLISIIVSISRSALVVDNGGSLFPFLRLVSYFYIHPSNTFTLNGAHKYKCKYHSCLNKQVCSELHLYIHDEFTHTY